MIRKTLGKLYVQVLIGVAAGIALGVMAPNLGSDLKPLGDVFIKLIKMVFAPIIFATVTLGIARMENMKELGRVGVRALLYFEVLSTFALALGLIVVNLVQPGRGMNVDPAHLDTKAIASYTHAAAKPQTFVDFLLGLVPSSIVDALARNDVLQILVFATLFGIALSRMGTRARPVVDFLDAFTHGVFSIVGMIMRLAPIAAFGAMAFTVGKYGLGSIAALGKLMATMYITCVLFVAIVLGGVARLAGFSLWKFLKYIQDEIFTVLGTSSSESVVPQLMRKLESAGVSKPVVGLVVPSGLTFNPDGQCIYYTMAAIFVAQATNTPLTLTDQLVVLGVLLLTSKGSAGVTGSGFITLAATLASLGNIPVAGMVLLLGIDRFMSEARAITNTIGNAVGTLAIARWVGAVDRQRLQAVLDGAPEEEAPPQTTHAHAHVPVRHVEAAHPPLAH
ncbi:MULTISPECIES: dicarboxylate/amino acid:cation symporter [Ralstonia solanacearum species complex]|uniref:C4-dicarboxylate transport protein n=2 Tax=Ralstonia syzygii TaxID=28097 RepID=G3A9Z3_9RALS|nr:MULTISPECIES: dicarboxylate/amino acid:cation symporter [Ralstonia solanacearum species complex]BEU74518.1 dicarboxylate/amino acid:cation symporter [Ralstonia pseudosolanacearum]AMP39944.1 C4-dicarboxylate transporter [Ralstonia solanacearum]AXV79371.1 dicarboxylate/amino acid:cation symporter [Ralstonia solanacearum]AXV88788.1 dicarboxylate/amino acid:cation symporter [Ralstonia solanacearum]AXV93392.1 dicarboxylate/amino acid:cation symporter [Ralstonia solanacearum]